MDGGERAPLLVEVLPDFAAELKRLLTDEGETEVAAAVSSLRVVDRCRCGEDFCGSFYAAHKPRRGWPPQLQAFPLEAYEDGMLVVDVVDQTIVYVEVLFNDDVRDRLARLDRVRDR